MQMSSISPSFTSHSSNNLADIAARVVEEFRLENGHDQLDDIYSNDFYDDIVDVEADHDGFFVSTEQQTEHDEDQANMGHLKEDEDEEEEEEEKEFEFAVVCNNNNSSLSPSSPISADEIFFNGEIVPRYPLFDQSLLLDTSKDNIVASNKTKDGLKPPSNKVVRQPLSMFFNEDRDSTVSCSSSEADDLDGAAPGTYCIWKPKEELLEEKCKKSNSTGNTSKRWRLRNLLSRSNSDRNFSKDDEASIVVFSPKKGGEKVKKFEKSAKVAGAEDDDDDGIEELPAQVVVNDSKSKSNRGGNRLRSIVSFKEDLVGVFANVNGFKGV